MSAPKSAATKAAKKSEAASSASDFKQLKKGRVLPLPSGLSVVARKVELRTFLKQGEVPNPLLVAVEEALNKGKEMDLAAMTGNNPESRVDMDMVNDMLEMVDKVVLQVVLEPKVHDVPEDEDDRDDDLLYVDELDDEDKMFLFQWASGQGTDDIAKFREEATKDLVSLAKS